VHDNRRRNRLHRHDESPKRLSHLLCVDQQPRSWRPKHGLLLIIPFWMNTSRGTGLLLVRPPLHFQPPEKHSEHRIDPETTPR
jgi:hypothetical protein